MTLRGYLAGMPDVGRLQEEAVRITVQPTRHIKILFFMLSQTNCKVIFTGGIIPEYGCEILVYPETDKTPVNFEMNRIRLLYCRFPVSNSTI